MISNNIDLDALHQTHNIAAMPLVDTRRTACFCPYRANMRT